METPLQFGTWLVASGTLAWAANLIIWIGLWRVGNKSRNAFLFTMVGEAMYACHVAYRHDWPIFFAVLIFFTLAARNYWKWGKDEPGCNGKCRSLPREFLPVMTTSAPSPFYRRDF